MKNEYIRDKINEYLELYTKLWAFSGSIIAIKDGEILFKKAYGYANIEHKVKNTTETKHKIWSITKQFTAVAILILEERGLLRVEDSLRKYFPDYAELNPNITIHHLLNHTSGIFNYSNLPDSHKTFQRMCHKKSDLIKIFLNNPLDFEPGTQWKYSNTGYFILGMLIEKLSGKNYSEFLTENIFIPLGMFNTGVDDGKKIIENKAKLSNISISQFLRELALQGQVDRKIKALPKEVLLFTATLNHLAANMNQVAYKRPRGDELNAIERATLQQEATAIRQLAKDIKTYLQ